MIKIQKNRGFTLIELVMVIVILGILAAFALPRFANLSEDAEKASIEGARASVKSSMGIIHSKALATKATGTTASPASVALEGANVEVVYGYLAATSVEDAAQLGDFSVLDTASDVGAGNAVVTIDDTTLKGKPCFNFTQSTATNDPSSVTAIGNMTDETTCDGS